MNRLGIVTSQDGAALRDILKVVRQRHSKVEIVLVHSAVQGLDAPAEIARGIRWLNRQNYVDLIIVGRGGGSFEDLMAFNSEEVVRAICESVIPVISAVGHEVDYCLADLAADLRAATPTQAAQLAVPDIDGLEADINNYRHRLIRAIDYKISYRSETLDRMMIKKIWTQPGVLLEERRHDVRELRQKLCQLAAERCKDKTMALSLAATALDKLSPLKVLQRGYAIASREGQIINKSEQVNIGDEINIDLYQDRLAVKVIGKETVIRWQ
ncbi:exodeoxyribonuclease VII large subunit [Syntrophomonas palmitatica]|uniref:exodeoxyribonuclease VII large subunit n=1 Tax=Syntrophomonas palmitatica TaxID=402877 RepID=UPI000A51EB80|nr:exodeoxyribonuclease VII large subunit [Syntrophomonas palmitatica]